MKSKKLWTKDFSCITLATVLSAIGGEAMTLPVSLLVFDETQSAFLSSLVMICGILPDVLLPIFIAPFIDKAGKKKWILGMDLMLAAVYAGMGFWVGRHTFHFLLYLLFTLTVGTISVIYRLAYASWYPDLIPRGMEQKGYAVSSTLYPTVIIVMSPIAAFLYENLTIDRIFFLVTGITLCSVMTESLIREAKKAAASSYTLRQSGHLQRYHPGERRAVLSAGTDAGQSQCLLQCTVRRRRGGLPVSGRRTWAVHPLSRCGGSAWRHGCRKRFPVHCSSCRRQPAGI